MAGHSHWANIAAKKSRIDKKRGKLFGKLSRAIIVAASHGGGDPDTNLALRYAIDKARKASMPNDNIDRAIKKGTGESSSEQYTEFVYEGYGPHGVAVMCHILTENRNRTAGEVRKIFDVHNGNLGSTGCVNWMFERKGFFLIPLEEVTEETLFEVAIEAGADDIKNSGETWEVYSTPDNFSPVEEALSKHEIPTTVAEISLIPMNTVNLEDIQSSRKILKLMEALEENDDVQSVTSNFNIPDEIMAELEEELS